MSLEFLDEFSILLLDSSNTRNDLFSSWVPGVTVKSITSPSELSHEFDSTVTVACLSQSLLDENRETVLQYILKRNPYCQLIGVIPRSAFVSPYEDEFDKILQRPVFKDDFKETIEYRYIAGVYTHLLSEYYDVNSTLVAIKRASDDEVKERQESIQRMKIRYSNLKDKLDALQENLTSETLMNVMQTIEQHKKHLTTPDKDITEGKETKYHQSRCPSCQLPWGVSHRNELGNGFEKIGADVYQCSRCESIVHGLAGEHRVV